MSKNNSNADIWIAGAVAAFTVDLIVYPLDTLKTRMQSPEYQKLFVNATTKTVNKTAITRGLYQGVGSVIVATLPSSGAFFSTYEGVKHLLATHNPRDLLPQPIIHAAASSTAELVSCAILTPAEVIKQNAQMVQNEAGKPKVNATLQTMQKFRSNPLALWRGYTALAGRNLPYTALQFPMFEKLKEYIKQSRERQGKRSGTLLESGLITAISAGSAGSVAAVITTPVDVVKTRIMLAAIETAAEDQKKPSKDGSKGGLASALGEIAKPASRKGSMQIGREIVAEHGIKGLWRGGALRAVWTMLGSGLYLSVYETTRVYLGSRRGEDIKEEDLF